MNKVLFELIKQRVHEQYWKGAMGKTAMSGDGYEAAIDEILTAINIEELIRILGELGFNKDDAYNFIHESIVEH